MFKIIEEENQLHCMFLGQLDTQACIEMEKSLKEAIKEQASSVVFNLKDVDYVCSRFLGICVQTAKTMPAKEFLIINVQPSIKKLFKISGLDIIIKIQ